MKIMLPLAAAVSLVDHETLYRGSAVLARGDQTNTLLVGEDIRPRERVGVDERLVNTQVRLVSARLDPRRPTPTLGTDTHHRTWEGVPQPFLVLALFGNGAPQLPFLEKKLHPVSVKTSIPFMLKKLCLKSIVSIYDILVGNLLTTA